MKKENLNASEAIKAAYESGKIERLQGRLDNNYMNPVSGFGGDKDPLNITRYNPRGNNSQQFYEALFQYNWLARKIVSAIPEDALREWIDIKSKNKDFLKAMSNALKKFKVKKKMFEAANHSRLYGGALIVIGADDGQEITEPLKEDSIKDIKYITVLDRFQVEVATVFNNPLEDNFGDPATYKIRPFNSLAGQGVDTSIIVEQEIHSSRTVKIDGEFLPDLLESKNNGWGDSTLLKVQRELKNYGTSMQSVAVLFQDFITKVLKIDNLANLLENEDSSDLEARIQFASANSSSLGITLIGEGEEYTKIQHPVTGLKELVETQIESVSAASDIPRARLFGQQLGKLSGATETTNAYFDVVRGFQVNKIESPLDRLLFLISKTKSFFPQQEEDWSWDWNSLKQDSNEQKAKVRLAMSQADKNYVEIGALSPEEIAENRFGEDGYSLDTVIDIEGREEFKKLDDELKKLAEEEEKSLLQKTEDGIKIIVEIAEAFSLEEIEEQMEEEIQEEERDTHIHRVPRGTLSEPLITDGGHVHDLFREGRNRQQTSEVIEIDGGHIHNLPDGTNTSLQIDGIEKLIEFANKNDQKQPTTLQSIIVSKKDAKTKEEAILKVKGFGEDSEIEETETSFRFKQKDSEEFKENSFRRFNPPGAAGITLVLGKLK